MKRCDNFKIYTDYLNFKIDSLENHINYTTTVENNLEFTTKVSIFKLCSKDALYGKHPKFRCGIIYSINDSYYVFITSEGEEFIVNDDSLLIVRD